MKIFTFGLAGLAVGAVIGYLNRPTYFGGLYKPSIEDLGSSERLAEDTIAVVLQYGLIGCVLGLVVGALLAKATKR